MKPEDIKIGSKWIVPGTSVVYKVLCVTDLSFPSREMVVYQSLSTGKYYTATVAAWPIEFEEVK